MRKKIFMLILSLFPLFNCFSEEYLLTVVFSESNNSKNKDFFAKAVQANGFYLKEQFIPMTLSQPKVTLPRMAYVYDIRIESENIDKFVRELKGIEHFEYVLLHELASTCCQNPHPPVNDAKIVDGTSDCYHLDLINARCAWRITAGNPNVKIGIADTDFELTHEDLKNQIVQISGVISAGHPHGTRVSGSAAAETNNGKGIAGIGYNSKIAAYRINHYITSNGGASASSYDIRNAVWDAYLDGLRIINVSWTSTGLTPIEAQIITGSGAVLTLGAGNTPLQVNHSTIANIPGVIVVSGVDRNNNYHIGHARNQYIDLCAPGIEIPAVCPVNNYCLVWSGTSQAAPMVAGTIALMLSVNPNLTPAEIETILKTTAAPINNAHLYPGLIGAGRLDAYAAVQAACATMPSTIDFFNQTINTDTTVNSCGNINVKNVKVKSGAKLILDAAGEINIISDFEIELGAEFEIINKY